MGRHFLLQGIFPNQGSNPGFPHCRQDAIAGRRFTESPGKTLCLLPKKEEVPKSGLTQVLLGFCSLQFWNQGSRLGWRHPPYRRTHRFFHRAVGTGEEGATDASTPPGGGREIAAWSQGFSQQFRYWEKPLLCYLVCSGLVLNFIFPLFQTLCNQASLIPTPASEVL